MSMIVAITVAVVALVAYVWWGLRFLAKVEAKAKASENELADIRRKRFVNAMIREHLQLRLRALTGIVNQAPTAADWSQRTNCQQA